MNRALRAVARGLFALLPGRSALLYRLAKKYIARYDGNNNADMNTNGELLFMRERLAHARVVFDVGANRGDWAARALEINPDIDLHCFEPSRPTFDALVARGFHARLNRFALGDKPGDARMFVHDDSGTSSLYDRRGVEHFTATGEETIQVRTADDYCAEVGIESIDFFKIDVEGHEMAVMRGMEKLFRTGHVKVIQFEYGGTNIDAHVLLKDVWELLEPHGYRFYKL
ncbi:MAG TPA: FkbM family methyltransferase, partial [Thermoanaerobaculia bacterium]|nr:FkbM family methyltransferase [Thermoanaerobaculia bacterium]